MSNNPKNMIGGPIGHSAVAATRIDPEDKQIPYREREALWTIFVETGKCWGNLPDDSVSVKSLWLEYIQAKTENEPSYAGEYENTISVVQELIEIYGYEEAFKLLFLENGILDGPLTTQIAHAKNYVVDEFIKVTQSAP